MFGSTILDVMAGVVFSFLGISLAASAVTEALNSLANARQNMLLRGLQNLLNDPKFTGLARALFNHALINPLSNGTATTVAQLSAKPAYIDGGHFATALMDIIRPYAKGASINFAIAALPDPQIRQTLQALLRRADDDETKLHTALGEWFDSSMERLTGLYKRRTQAIAFIAALALAMLLNVDALNITTELWRHPALMQALPAAIATGKTAATSSDLASAPELLHQLDQSTLIGWNGFAASPRNPFGPNPSSASIFNMLIGWLIVAGASLYGAPFWFDTLQRIAQLRGTGAATPEKPAA